MTTARTARHKRRAFLAAYADLGNLTAAARRVGVDRRRHYEWLNSDPSYCEAFEEAEVRAVEVLEAEARRRAVEGYEVAVWHKGEQVGAVRRYSDTLLMFLLKGARPERYRDRYDPTQRRITMEDLEAEIRRLENEAAEKEVRSELARKRRAEAATED